MSSKEYNRAYQAEWRKTHRESIKASNDKWKVKNREKILAAARARRVARYWKNPEAERSGAREWSRAHPEARKIAVQKRRSLLYAAKVRTLTQEQWLSVLTFFGNVCAYCLRPSKLTIDHIQPLSRGGEHSIDNVVPACRSCNSSKNTKSLPLWVLKKRAA